MHLLIIKNTSKPKFHTTPIIPIINIMKTDDYRKHYRSTTITQYEDFEIRPEDQKKIDESPGELSTKETPIQDGSNEPLYIFEIRNAIETISNDIKLELNSKLERLKGIKNLILEEFFRLSSSSLKKKKNKKPNKSIGKLPKKALKLVPSRSKVKLLELNTKKPALATIKQKNPHIQSMNLPKLSSREIKFL
jgi:hypothetical protein